MRLTLGEFESTFEKMDDNGINVREIVLIDKGNTTGPVFSGENLRKLLVLDY
jgi:hypothetical protein